VAEIKRITLFGKLSPLPYKALEGATVSCKIRGNPFVELVHWLRQLTQVQDSDVAFIFRHFAIDPALLAADLDRALDQLPRGADRILDFSPDVESLTERGWIYATLLFDETVIRSGHLVVALLKSELRHKFLSLSRQFQKLHQDRLTDSFAEITKDSAEFVPKPAPPPPKAEENNPQPRTIFISYRRGKTDSYAADLHSQLKRRVEEEKLKIRVFIDDSNIAPGKKVWSVIRDAIESCVLFIILVGPDWLEDKRAQRSLTNEHDWVRRELEEVLKKGEANVEIVPVTVLGAKWPPALLLPQSIAPVTDLYALKWQATPYSDWRAVVVQRLLDTVKSKLGRQ
jgi:hypothetical protein